MGRKEGYVDGDIEQSFLFYVASPFNFSLKNKQSCKCEFLLTQQELLQKSRRK